MSGGYSTLGWNVLHGGHFSGGTLHSMTPGGSKTNLRSPATFDPTSGLKVIFELRKFP